jgi:hypothetical protein
MVPDQFQGGDIYRVRANLAVADNPVSGELKAGNSAIDDPHA